MPYQAGNGPRGAWSRRTQTQGQAALQAPVDPEHLTPTDNPEFSGQRPSWVNTAPAPVLPDVMVDGQGMPYGQVGVQLDNTPIDHAYGMGSGPGLDTLEAQDYRMAWHAQDDGSVAQHQYHPMVDRDDRPGSPGAAFIRHEVGASSPETLQLERTGYGQPNDPNAPLGRAFRRWRDRYLDLHRFQVELRPLAPRYARGNQAQPAVVENSQTTSPYATSVTAGVQLTTQDKFVGPLVRRQPGPWDEGLATDGSASAMSGAPNNYGLGTWGL